MPIYLKIDGIDGEVTAAGFEKTIEVLSFSWGVTQSSSRGTGGGGGAGKASFQDIHFVQSTQSSSPLLLKAVATGQHIKNVLMTFIKGESNKGGGFLKIKLEDVLVSSYQAGGAEGSNTDTPSEEVSLNFAKIEFDYTAPDGTEIDFAFDVLANQ
ncbi:MAG TPA: type VI secretion system tube protein Hcp [Gaiellaceae bacterium]